MITDEEIRAALDRVVARAPDPARIRAGFASRARAHRQRRALLVAGGALAAAGALGVPSILAWRDRRGQGPGDGTVPITPDVRTPPNLGPAVAEPIPNAAVQRVAMRYRPSWLPEGYVEMSRTASVGSDASNYQSREWMRVQDAAETPDKNSEPPPYIRLVLVPASRLELGDWRIPAKINGADGGVSLEDGQIPQVIWRIGNGLHLAVQVGSVGDDRTVALWIARSVEPDGVAGVECPLRFGWLPESLTGEHQVSLTQWGDTWRATLQVISDRIEVASVVYGQGITLPPDGTESMVRGRQGIVRSYENGGGWAYVFLNDGRDLLVSIASGSGVAVDDVVRIADKLDLGPPLYHGWIGQR